MHRPVLTLMALCCLTAALAWWARERQPDFAAGATQLGAVSAGFVAVSPSSTPLRHIKLDLRTGQIELWEGEVNLNSLASEAVQLPPGDYRICSRSRAGQRGLRLQLADQSLGQLCPVASRGKASLRALVSGPRAALRSLVLNLSPGQLNTLWLWARPGIRLVATG